MKRCGFCRWRASRLAHSPSVPIPRVRMCSPIFGEYARRRYCGQIDGHPELVTFYQPELEAVLAPAAWQLSVGRGEHGRRAARLRRRMARGVAATGSTAIARLGDGRARLSCRRRRCVVARPQPARTSVQGPVLRRRTGSLSTPRHVLRPDRRCRILVRSGAPGPHMIAPGGRQRWEFMLQPGRDADRGHGAPSRLPASLLRPWIGNAGVRDRALPSTASMPVRPTASRKAAATSSATPPTSRPHLPAKGSSSGLRDAANLSWKLAWVVAGRCAPAILDSYDVERRPHAKAMYQFRAVHGRASSCRAAGSRRLLDSRRDARSAGMIPGLRKSLRGSLSSSRRTASATAFS